MAYTIAQIRKACRETYGKYRITAGGEIHIYGVMPNTSIVGWWLLGPVDDVVVHCWIGLES